MLNLFKKYAYTQIGDQVAKPHEGAVSESSTTYCGAFTGRTWKEIDAEEKYRIYAVATGDTRPVRNWSEPIRYRHCSKRYRNGGETHLLIKEMRIGNKLYAGDYCEISPGYYSELVEMDHGEGDYCVYCGTFNGKDSEHRQGYDCYFCGSN